jgi:serine/threonine protein kinase
MRSLPPSERAAWVRSGVVRDTRLDRNVAIKILPGEFARNVQLKVRFEREARAISQLNHPHICTLYDVGDSFLVMELLEGESLADRLARGSLPLTETILGWHRVGAIIVCRFRCRRPLGITK